MKLYAWDFEEKDYIQLEAEIVISFSRLKTVMSKEPYWVLKIETEGEVARIELWDSYKTPKRAENECMGARNEFPESVFVAFTWGEHDAIYLNENGDTTKHVAGLT